MKQKYVIIRDDEKNALVLQEHAELDKELLSQLCEETYAGDMVAEAIGQGKEALISRLRTKNMYPPSIYMDRIADQVMELYGLEGDSSAEVLFDDVALIIKDREEAEALAMEDDVADLDDLLDDDDDDDAIEDEFGDDESLNISSKASLKIADDDSLGGDEDV